MEEYFLVADFIVKVRMEVKDGEYVFYMENGVKRVKEFDGRDGLRIIEGRKKKIVEQFEKGNLIYRGFLL